VGASSTLAAASVNIDNYTSTTAGKVISSRGIYTRQDTSGNAGYQVNGGWHNGTAISSLTFLNSSGNNWSSGTIFVYGVK
jgi:hypothetical protein